MRFKVWKLINHNEYPTLTSRYVSSISTLQNNKVTLVAQFKDRLAKKNVLTTPILSKLSFIKSLFKKKTLQQTQTLVLIFLRFVY